MAKSYNRTGIRRDKNLSDLSNTVSALNNLLDTLIDTPSNTFVSEDLDAIRGIYASGMVQANYRYLIGNSISFTDSDGISQPFLPRITYQNRLDRLRLFSGRPRLNGGDGLTAKYYNQTNVFENTVGIFSGQPFKINNFWENGNFNYTGKITEQSVDVNGGVEWEGFFIPTVTGVHRFDIQSTACFTFDFQREEYTSGINTYTEISRIGLSSSFAGVGTAGNNVVFVNDSSNLKYIAIGQSVSSSGISTGSIVNSINYQTNTISLTPPTGQTSAVFSNFSGNINFFKSIGQDTRIFYNTYPLSEFEKYRIRIRYYIPSTIDASTYQRNIVFNLTPPNSTFQYLRYTYLYGIDYDFSESSKGILNNFIDNSVLFGGGTVGIATTSSKYVKVSTSGRVDITYQPKTSLNSIVRSNPTVGISSTRKSIEISDTSNIEVGNYVFGGGIPENTRIEYVGINAYIILDKLPTISYGSTSLTIIDHRGFVKRCIGYGGTGTFTITSGNTQNLRTNMIMIGSGVSAYTGITTSGSSNIISISPSQTISETPVYFYQSRGLIDNSLNAYCIPSQTRCLIVGQDTAAGSTVISVASTVGVSTGWFVLGTQFSNGTTVTGIGSTTITISSSTLNNLISGSNFTVTNQSGNRSLCCPPTDTSPPFNPTLFGLETVADAPSLRIESGNLIFDSLRAEISAGNITNYLTSDTSRSRLAISTPSGTFRILCS